MTDVLHAHREEERKKLQDAIERAQALWTEEFGLLDRIAVDVYHGKRGGFLKKYVAAWMHADASNKRLMWLAWVSLIVKYDLVVDPTGTGAPRPRDT